MSQFRSRAISAASSCGCSARLGIALGCDECFDQLDAYVELELTGVRADIAMPAMRAHLMGCSACRDDHDSLLAFARTDPANSAYDGPER